MIDIFRQERTTEGAGRPTCFDRQFSTQVNSKIPIKKKKKEITCKWRAPFLIVYCNGSMKLTKPVAKRRVPCKVKEI